MQSLLPLLKGMCLNWKSMVWCFFSFHELNQWFSVIVQQKHLKVFLFISESFFLNSDWDTSLFFIFCTSNIQISEASLSDWDTSLFFQFSVYQTSMRGFRFIILLYYVYIFKVLFWRVNCGCKQWNWNCVARVIFQKEWN